MKGLIVGLALLAPGLSQAGTVTVEVTGVAKDAGRIVVSVCDAEQFRRRVCGRQAGTAATAKSVAVTFEGIAEGRYVITVYQDLNGNGRLDENRLGIPTDPAALSGAWRPIPILDKIAVSVGAAPVTVRIALP